MSFRGVLSFELTWQVAAITAACLMVLAAFMRLPRFPRIVPSPRLVRFGWLARVPVLASRSPVPVPGRRPRVLAAAAIAQELGTLTALFALWRLAGQYSVLSLNDALSRGQWLWHAERVVHLPNETSVQAVFLPHPILVEGFNLFYAALHFTALVIWLVWLFFRHRDSYRRWRTTLVLFTFGSLLVQLIPVAPPRMLPGTGLVDTALRYGQSVYGSDAGFSPDQLSAMPSVHVGWALLIALTVVCVSRSRWRWFILAYPALTTLAVVVTANHYWLDGIAAAGLLALGLVVQLAGRASLRTLAAAGRIPGWAARSAVLMPAVQAALPAADRHPAPVPAAAKPAAATPAANVKSAATAKPTANVKSAAPTAPAAPAAPTAPAAPAASTIPVAPPAGAASGVNGRRANGQWVRGHGPLRAASPGAAGEGRPGAAARRDTGYPRDQLTRVCLRDLRIPYAARWRRSPVHPGAQSMTCVCSLRGHRHTGNGHRRPRRPGAPAAVDDRSA